MDDAGILVKAAITSLIAAISMKLDILGDLLWLFIAGITLDYLTGIISAVYLKELSSGQGLRGIIKKAGECCVIAVAIIADDVVLSTASSLGQDFSTGNAIAVVVTTWLILNELISILENIDKMHIPLPPFLMAALRSLKKHTEE